MCVCVCVCLHARLDLCLCVCECVYLSSVCIAIENINLVNYAGVWSYGPYELPIWSSLYSTVKPNGQVWYLSLSVSYKFP